MRAARVIPLAGVVTMLAPYPLAEAQEERLRAVMKAYAQARTTCTIVVLEAPPTDERFVIRPPSGITPAARTMEPTCAPSHVIPAPESAAARAATAPLAPPPFSVPAATSGEPAPHPLTEGLAGRLKPR